uniref:Sulfotransfer_1 domain-containing protein n=1 Tax=Parastrongyloides trichosuri TaxID=131310 RepID=A0A0N4ZJ56_PARTI
MKFLYTTINLYLLVGFVLSGDYTNKTIDSELKALHKDVQSLGVTQSPNTFKCSNRKDNRRCAGFVKLSRQEFYVLPKNKISTCVIQKNFSSMMIAIMCYLFNENVFYKKNDHLADNQWDNLECRRRNFVRSNKDIINKYNYGNMNKYLKEWSSILIVRDPVDRFISGYMHHCSKEFGSFKFTKKCFNCKGNFNCFIKRLYKAVTSNPKIVDAYDSHIKQHFFPQTWRCEYFQYKHFYKILKYDSSNLPSFYESLIKIFTKKKVATHKIDYINKEIHTVKSYHATSGKKATIKFKENLYKNEKVLTLLKRIYYPDFKEFGFPFPEVQIDKNS